MEGKAGLSRSELRPPVCSFVGCRVSNAEVSSVSGKTWTAHIILPSTLMHPRPRPAIIFLRASVRLGRTAGRCRSYAPSSPLPSLRTQQQASLHFTSLLEKKASQSRFRFGRTFVVVGVIRCCCWTYAYLRKHGYTSHRILSCTFISLRLRLRLQCDVGRDEGKGREV